MVWESGDAILISKKFGRVPRFPQFLVTHESSRMIHDLKKNSKLWSFLFIESYPPSPLEVKEYLKNSSSNPPGKGIVTLRSFWDYLVAKIF
jgi:hypothetical protein